MSFCPAELSSLSQRTRLGDEEGRLVRGGKGGSERSSRRLGSRKECFLAWCGGAERVFVCKPRQCPFSRWTKVAWMSEWVKGRQRRSGGAFGGVVADAESECRRKERPVVLRSVVVVNEQDEESSECGHARQCSREKRVVRKLSAHLPPPPHGIWRCMMRWEETPAAPWSSWWRERQGVSDV